MSKNGNLLSVIAFCLLSFVVNSNAEWLNHGGDITNTRSYIRVTINPITVRVGLLRQRRKFLAGFNITATPSVAGGVVYFPSWNGNLYAVDATTGALIWHRSLSQLTGIPPTGTYVNATVSRVTPVVAGDLLLVAIYGPAYVVAAMRSTGLLVWSTRVDPGPLSVVTASGTIYKGFLCRSIISGIIITAGQCCTFQGSLVELDVRTGNILWQTYTLPDNGGKLGGYSRAAIWGSSPSIDTRRGLVYAGTGNLYIAPADVLQCQARQNNATTPPSQPDQCFGPGVHLDSLTAFDLNSGRIVWARSYNVFYFMCLVPNNLDCPPGPNLDADFGEAPMQLTIFSNGRFRDVVVAVQKSDFAWDLDHGTGDIVWFTKAGPGSLEGGGVWGAATDGVRVYTNIVNANEEAFTLKSSTQTTTAGDGWPWMPTPETGPVYATNGRTGAIIWRFKTGATVYGGASSSYGCILLGIFVR